MRVYRRGYRPPGAITRSMARARMPKPTKARGAIMKGMCCTAMPKVSGITAKQVATQAGIRLRRSGVKIGTASVELPPGANINNFTSMMRGAGYAVRKEDLRKLQRR